MPITRREVKQWLPERVRRPQWLVLMLFSVCAYAPTRALSAGSIITTLEGLGITSPATRSTLSRMVDRGLLRRHRNGREMFYGLTSKGWDLLKRGRDYALDAGRTWDGHWTIVGVSIPERRRAARYRATSRLSREGFGQLRNGLWITPRLIDIPAALEGLDVLEQVYVFTGSPTSPTTISAIIADAYDLKAIASRYAEFVERWAADDSDPLDSLAALVALLSEWAQVVRADPRLPLKHLPTDWPAIPALELFIRRQEEFFTRVQETTPALRSITVKMT